MIQLKTYNNVVILIGDAKLTTSAEISVNRGGGDLVNLV